MSNNDREIMKQILDYDEQMTKVEKLVNDLQYFLYSSRRRNDLLLSNNQVEIILDALKQVYGVKK